MPYKATTAIYLDIRNIKKDDTFPVKLRVTYRRRQKYYATGHSLSQVDYEKVISERPGKDLKDLSLTLGGIEKRASEIIKSLPVFSFPAFEKLLLSGHGPIVDVFQLLEETIDSILEEKRIRTAETYRNSLKSLQRFHNRKSLEFSEISVDFLKAYERWMLEKGRSVTTIGIYLRSLRAIYNTGIQRGYVLQQEYPFGKQRYQIPNSRNVKKALTIEDIKQIFTYQAEPESSEARYQAYWLFSYLCNGINMKDMALLTYGHIDGDQLRYLRAKTERSTRNDQKMISVPVLPEMEQIIQSWGNPKLTTDTYVFRILIQDMNEQQQLAMIRQEIKQVNKYMRRIGKKLGIEKDITTYTARHSFSTILKRSGASTEFISESLGHKSLNTTERYLDSFEDKAKREFANKLLDF